MYRPGYEIKDQFEDQSGKNTYRQIIIGQKINLGYEGVKFHASDDNDYRYVIKFPYSSSINPRDESCADQVMKKYRILHPLGIMAYGWMAISRRLNAILMPDLSENYFIYSNNARPVPNRFKKNYLEKHFVNFASIAFEAGVYLSRDTYAILEDKESGKVFPKLLDIGSGTVLLKDANEMSYPFSLAKYFALVAAYELS